MSTYQHGDHPVPNILIPRPQRTSSLPPNKRDTSKDSTTNRQSTASKRQSTTQDVLTNLIDSLSTQNTPATPFFDLPDSNEGASIPNSPFTIQSPRHEDYYDAHGDGHYDEEDAAEPPVVRTTKPPSGKSLATAHKSKKETFRTYLSRSESHSRRSSHSSSVARTQDQTSADNGGESRGSRRPSEQSIRSKNSAESKHSSRNKSLFYRSSREGLRNRERDQRSSSVGPTTAGASSNERNTGGAIVDVEAMMGSSIQEESPIPNSPKLSITTRRGKAPKMLSLSPATPQPAHKSPRTPNHLSPAADIPARRSSLKSSSRSPRRKEKRKSALEQVEMTTNGENGMDESPLKAKSNGIMKEPDFEEESAALRRVRELKMRIQSRASSEGSIPAQEGQDHGTTAGSRLVVNPSDYSHDQISPVSDSQRSPMPTSDNAAKGDSSMAKAPEAHKVPELRPTQPTNSTPPAAMSRLSRASTNTDHGQMLGQSKSLTSSPQVGSGSLSPQLSNTNNPLSSDSSKPRLQVHTLQAPRASVDADLESTFLDYKLMVSSLEETAAAGDTKSRSLRPKSSHATRKVTAPFTFSRSKTSNELNGGSGHHRRRSSAALDGRDPMQPSATMPVLASRPEKKPKRLSHPDLPLEVEKGNRRVLPGKKTRAPAVQAPEKWLQEEKHSSIDSIDAAVSTFINAPRLSQRIRHPSNGRIISFSEVGDPHGFAVFCCVGMGLTRYVTSFYDELAKTLKLRLITPDRPGIGGSQADTSVTPMTWTDDIYAICATLKISKFALLAHSAGAVYALATALRMPQHIRGRVHLLAPWIPPSQMAPIGLHQDAPGTDRLPRSQRFLRTLPPSLLKIANASFLSPASASVTRTKQSPRTPRPKRRSISLGSPVSPEPTTRPTLAQRQESLAHMDREAPSPSALAALTSPSNTNLSPLDPSPTIHENEDEDEERARRDLFDERLTLAIWDRATANANPATDLVVCLETKHTIGFRYEDITRKVVIHHGSKDNRVPPENVKWLGGIMRQCEVRILDGEGHGLMANPIVMGGLLSEMAQEWEDWERVVQSSKTHGSSGGMGMGGLVKKASQNFLKEGVSVGGRL